MARILLTEYFSYCDDCVINMDSLLTERELKLRDNGAKFLTGICQRAGIKNGNGRIYSKNILEKEVRRYHSQIQNNSAYGQLDHPDDSVIELGKASHMCAALWWNGHDLMGKFRLLNTPNGQIAQTIMEDGGRFGISSRGLGSIKETNQAIIVEDDFELICFDLVTEPSTQGAYLDMKEGQSKVSRYINEVLSL